MLYERRIDVTVRKKATVHSTEGTCLFVVLTANSLPLLMRSLVSLKNRHRFVTRLEPAGSSTDGPNAMQKQQIRWMAS